MGEGEGRGLRRQGGARRAPREPSPSPVLCTLTIDDHTSRERREALPARPRADPDAGRRAAHRRERPPLVRHERGRRPVARQAHADVVPAAGAGRGRDEAGRRVHAASATRSRSTIVGSTPLFDPENDADPLVKILVCVKRVPITGGRIVLTDDAQEIETQHLGFTISPARGVRGRGGGADRRGGRRRGRRARRSDRPRRRSSCATAWRSAPTAGILIKTDGQEWDRAGDRGGDRRRGARRGAVRPDPVRQRVGGLRQLPGRDPRCVRARPAGRHGAEEDRRRRRTRPLRARRQAARATSTKRRFPPS